MSAEGVATGATDEPEPRFTRQRRAIEATMSQFNEFRSAQEIYEAMRRDGEHVGLSTVYRGVRWLVSIGNVDMVHTDSGEAVYRRCSATHHHHLVCRRCGRTVEIEGPTVEKWAAAVAVEYGYADVNHTIELFGQCAQCRRTASSP